MNVLITGGAGFIGSNFVELLLNNDHSVTVLDKLSYAGHLKNLEPFEAHEKFNFVQGDICDSTLVNSLLTKQKIQSLVHFAAESHVDRSIHKPAAFIETNITGTFNLLNMSYKYWLDLPENSKKSFKFIQVSTDEVYGTLGDEGHFSEKSPYAPNSPYSASKAAGDHLARAWYHTYQFPTIITNCSNNYGPKQFPEKLIPHIINQALQENPLPVYGDGQNVRDWIHVEDHCSGVYLALTKGLAGETYCFGGNSEKKNLDVVKTICSILDQKVPRKNSQSYETLIEFVTDRKGHDWRYAIDDTKASTQLQFNRKWNFESGLSHTINWYLENTKWIQTVLEKK